MKLTWYSYLVSSFGNCAINGGGNIKQGQCYSDRSNASNNLVSTPAHT